MKYLFLTVLGALSIFCSTQQAQEWSPTEFQKLKSDCGKMIKSENYVSLRATSKELAKKLNQIKGWEDFKCDDTWDRWITENISKTMFSSIEEANHLRNQMLALTRKNKEEYREMWIRFKLASRQQRLDLLATEYNGKSE